ncbi:MAG: glycosyltransferase family 39 protein [Bacteroidota bacterium]
MSNSEHVISFFRKKANLIWPIVLIASVLRLYGLTNESLWIDELVSAVIADPKNTLGFITEFCFREDGNPPLYYLILNLWFNLFGYSDFNARLLSALFGILGVFSVYSLGRKAYTINVGLICALLSSINFFLIYYAQEVRVYSMLFLFTCVLSSLLIDIYRFARFKNYFLYGLCSLIIVYSHYYGFFVLIAHFVWILVQWQLKKIDRKVLFEFWGTLIIIGVFYLPWVLAVIRLSTIDDYFTYTPRITFIFDYIYKYWGKNPVALIIMIFSIFVFFRRAAKKSYDLLFGLLFFIPLLLPFIRSVIVTPILEIRYTIVVLPALLMIISRGLNAINKKRLKTVLMLVWVLASILNISFVKKYYLNIEKTQWRELAYEVSNFHGFNGEIIYVSKAQRNILHSYYLKKINTEINVLTYEDIDFEGVTDSEAFWTLGPIPSDMKYLKDHFNLIKVIEVKGIGAKLFTRAKKL